MKLNHQGISNPYEVIVVTIFVSILFITGMYAWQQYSQAITLKSVVKDLQKERTCPDAWIVDRMPSISSTQPREYFVIRGQRRELSDFDVEWVVRTCALEKQIVY